MKGQKIHMVGIGGIGMSALAQLYFHAGARVVGSDRAESPVTDYLRGLGIEVFVGHEALHVASDITLLVYSDAVLEGSEGYVERTRAQELGIPERSYFQALGSIANEKKVIAIAGAHGKTTTTAMTIDVLEAGGLDPTGVVGSLRAKTHSNFRAGEGEYFVVEADEYRRHLLEFTPYIGVITNIDADHLDYYRDLVDVQSAFRAFAEKISADGFLVCDVSHENVAPILPGLACTIVDYKKYFDPNLSLRVLPLHRINAAVVLAVADLLHIELSVAKQALAMFAGTWRRFEYKGKTKSGADIYDDYGHHPTEVRVTLASAREQFPDRKVFVAFHPHLYSRTKLLFNDFVHAFVDADELLAPIFAAREIPDPSISSELLAEKIQETGTLAQAFATFAEIESYLTSHAGKDDIVVTMGAGDIYKVADALTKDSV